MSGQNSDDRQHYTEAVGTRLSPQTKEMFNEYREANELSNSEALRRLLRESLEPNRYAGLAGAGALAGASWIVFVALGVETGAVAVGGLYIVFGLLWSLYPTLRERFG